MKGFTAAVLSALPLLAAAATTPEKAQAVRNALTNVDKINALEDKDFVFDFNDPALKATTGAGGKLVSANIGNFAALVGNGLAMTVGHLEPCGINSPHTHPRATEILIITQGQLTSGFLTENGSRFVVNNMTELTAAVFPKGSIHFQANMGCDPVQFVAALSNEDPGTTQVAQRFFALTADVVGASLGGLGVEEVQHLAQKIPDNVIAGTHECLMRCGISVPDQPTKQQQQPPATQQQPPSGGSTTWTQPPSTTTTYAPQPPPSSSPRVIDVIVGKDLGLTYMSDDISAKPNDVVRFHFVSKNHTVTQSTFDMPCEKMSGGFDSGFMPIPQGSTEEKTYDVLVKDEKPIWFYCQQKAAGAPLSHCQQGMNGAINAPKTGSKTLNAFKTKASSSD